MLILRDDHWYTSVATRRSPLRLTCPLEIRAAGRTAKRPPTRIHSAGQPRTGRSGWGGAVEASGAHASVRALVLPDCLPLRSTRSRAPCWMRNPGVRSFAYSCPLAMIHPSKVIALFHVKRTAARKADSGPGRVPERHAQTKGLAHAAFRPREPSTGCATSSLHYRP